MASLDTMRLQSILIALSTLLRIGVAAYDDVRPQPGVGISLSSGYATVSALLPNRSYIDVAKVEGGATYKAYMLGLRGEPIKIISPSYCPFSRRVCQYWPFKTLQIQNALAPMLKALVASAESALETNIVSVAVSAYDIDSINYELAKGNVHSALSELGIDGYGRLDHVVRQLAPALGIRGNCSGPYLLPEDSLHYHNQEQLLFTLEYTRESTTAGLWKEECGVMEITDRWNSAQLGHNAMQTCRETAKDKTICEEYFKSTLRSVIKNSSRNRHEEIGPVLIYGECADDNDMRTMLRQVLTEQFPNGDPKNLSCVQNFSPDPAFAGSRSMARAMWEAHGSEY